MTNTVEIVDRTKLDTSLLDVPEWRGFSEFEIRSDGHDFKVAGHAAVFEHIYPVMGGAEEGGWDERVDRSAFDRTLSQTPDVHFLINHAGVSLARTKSGTLRLSTDSTGLLAEARIDRRTSDGRDLEIRMERGDLDEMSIGFRTKRHVWDGDLRTLLEVDLHKGDVSVVNNGSNDATRIALAPPAMLEALSAMQLHEIRSVDDPLGFIREMRKHLSRLETQMMPAEKRTLSFDEAMRIAEGIEADS